MQMKVCQLEITLLVLYIFCMPAEIIDLVATTVFFVIVRMHQQGFYAI